jgi:hypothetical protein
MLFRSGWKLIHAATEKMTILTRLSSQQLTVAPRERGGTFDLTVQAVQRAVEGARRACAARRCRRRVVVVEVPNDVIADFKRALGDAFFVDPNAKLRLD